MVITYYGAQFFKVQLGDTTIAFNPISKDSKLKTSRFGADVVLVSLNHPDTNGSDQLTFGEKVPLVIAGPGEYEIKGIFIKGILSKTNYGGEEKINTVYVIELDDIRLCFLGSINSTLTSDMKEDLGEVDILFVPIGGNGTYGSEDGYKVATSLEPKIIIPMNYEDDKNALKLFLKEEGSTDSKPVDKLTIKKKDLEGKDSEIVVLEKN
ncbi:MAG: MBL fold metallo-hydrolase [Candidatus Paceibacterota bacterium]